MTRQMGVGTAVKILGVFLPLEHKIRTFDMVNAGDQLSFKISRQIPPLLLILQW